MPLTETIKQLRDRWMKEKDQRAYVRELLCIYDGDWTKLIYEALKERFLLETLKDLKVEIDPTLNLVQRVVDEVAAIYTEPAVRMVEGEEPVQYVRDGVIDDLFDEADKMLLLCRNILLRPYVVEEGMDVDVITPDRFTVLTRSGRRGQIDAVAYEVPEKKRIVIWTKDFHTVVKTDWQLDMEFGIQPNEYGLIPVLPIFEAEPMRDWWQVKRSEALKQLALVTAQSLSDLSYAIKMTSYKKLVVRLARGGVLETSNEQMMDVAYPFVIKGEGEIGTVDITTDFGMLLDVIFKRAAAPLAKWGLRPEMIRQGGLDATSGYHLALQLSGLTKQHQRRAKRWKVRERRLYDIAQAVMDVERRRPDNRDLGLMPLPVGKLSVNHGDLGPPKDRKEEAEYWGMLVDKGFAETVDAIKAIHGLTQEEAEEKLARIMAERSARVAASVFGMGLEQEPESAAANPEAGAVNPPPFGAMQGGGDV